MPEWVATGFNDYARRMPREMALMLTELKPEARPANAGAAAITRIIEAEAQRIVSAVPKGAMTIVLDETGKLVTTLQLSQRLSTWRDSGRDVALIIGGADGTSAALKKSADWLWSLSPLTLPHGLVRVVLAEQLYRAWSVLGNHPYHRAELRT